MLLQRKFYALLCLTMILSYGIIWLLSKNQKIKSVMETSKSELDRQRTWESVSQG